MPQISDVFQNYGFKNDRLTLLAGPCAIESYETCAEVAETLKQLTDELGINYVFKSSFDKANRSSIDSQRGAGMAAGLKVLANIKENYHVPIVTDVHEPYQCEPVAEVADVLQIPAYLSRQTDLLLAAGKTGRVVNIKKAQFMAPEDIQTAVDKVATNDQNILVTERGTMFGYHQLVVDMTSLIQMRATGYPVIFDATHSVQVPSGYGNHSGGNRDYAFPLMRAALAIGIDGIFAEVHPNPSEAISDQDSQLYLSKIRPILENANRLFHEHLEMKAVYAHDDLL